jgi:hypothetical protein
VFGRGSGSSCVRRSNRFVRLGSLSSLLVMPLALIAIRTTLRRLPVATKALRLLSRLRIAICPSDSLLGVPLLYLRVTEGSSGFPFLSPAQEELTTSDIDRYTSALASTCGFGHSLLLAFVRSKVLLMRRLYGWFRLRSTSSFVRSELRRLRVGSGSPYFQLHTYVISSQ